MGNLILPSSITNIGYAAFTSPNNRIQSITVTTPNSYYSSVGGVLFNASQTELVLYPTANSATTYAIPSGVTSIDDYSFCASGIASLTMPNTVTNIGSYAFQYLPASNIAIPNSVISIGEGAFMFAHANSITLGNSLQNIGDYAFFDSGLTAVSIPGSVTNIGSCAFDYCLSLNNITVAGSNQYYSSIGGVLFNHSQTQLIQYPPLEPATSYAIPNSVTTIGVNAFDDAINLTSLTIPNSVTCIDLGAFDFVGWLPSITIPSSVTNISYLPANFNITPLLTSIPSGNYVGTFVNDDALNSIYFLGNAPQGLITNNFNYDTFYGTGAGGNGHGLTIYYLNGTSGWGSNGWAPAFQLTQSGYNYIATNGAITITSATGSSGAITVPSTLFGVAVAGIGASAYAGSSVTSVSIPSTVTSIGSSAFSGCSGLTSVSGGNVTSIGDNAFYNCSGLTSITIGSSITSIGSSAFSGCSHLTSISLGNNITSIGNSAFYGCSDLTSVAIGNNVTSIGSSTFYNCSGLTSVSLGNSINSIGTSAFHNCSGLTSLTIPDSVTSIGNNAFSYCSGLLTVTIGKGVISIGTGAFNFSTSLQQAFFKGDAPSVNGGAGSADSTVFQGETGTAYYVPGYNGWGATYGSWPTAGWYQPQPQILDNLHGLGVQGNRFNLVTSWATSNSVVVQASTNLINWTTVATNTLVNGTNIFADSSFTNFPHRYYRVLANVPAGIALIPAGSFVMGDKLDGESDALPTNVYVSQFYMDTNLVSYSLWQTVYSYATNHGYGFDNPGTGKATNNPVQTVSWYDCVKWCNARSAQAGLTPVYYKDSGLTQVYTNGDLTPYVNWNTNGYRLPTEAEWEKAARGGLAGQRFPLGNTISESQANYDGNTAYSYDLGPNGYNTVGNYPTTSPGTSPVNSFPANGYGLNDMAGNVFVWCWDWYAGPTYPTGSPYLGGTDPRGPAGPLSYRVLRGGCWADPASYARCAFRYSGFAPTFANYAIGFRCVRAH